MTAPSIGAPMRRLVLVFLAACGPAQFPASDPRVAEVIETSRQGIIGGAPAGTDDPEVFGLILFMQGGQGICTSTLIGARTLLTAAHCVENVTAVYASNTANLHTVSQSQLIEAVDWR